ncbi:MAG: elongation factor Ts [Bacteroidetes bacterium]|nr:elongation factor Ts [Bacteroidota bacterium]
MAEITAKDVQVLREKTGAGMMDCKKALGEANGDLEKAVEILRKKGAAVAAKRADREAKEGLVLAKVSADKKSAILVEVNCETDFVARNETFSGFAEQVAVFALESGSQTLDQLLDKKAPFTNGQSIRDYVTELTGKTGEKIEVRRLAAAAAPAGQVIDYIHPGSRLGVLVVLETAGSDSRIADLGKDIAMQVAAANPMVLTRDLVNTDKINSELEIYKTQARNEKKPEAVIERIAVGKLEKFYEDNVLVEQKFVKDPSKTIKTIVEETSKATGSPVTIKRFVRFLIGESL